MPRWLYGLLVASALLRTTDAHSFCRNTTCKDCPRDPETLCITGGQPLFWPGACVSYALSRRASSQVDLETASDVVARAFDAWQSVTCPGTGEPPSIKVTDAFGHTGCSLAEYSHTGVNANVVLFRDQEWPYVNSEDALGLTSVSSDSITGRILDADIEINSTVLLSTTDQVPPDHDDLLSILTHEVGHFLGLGHSKDPHSVMQPSYMMGTASLRVPNEDDIAGICSIYPPDRRTVPCDFTPKGGFASECPLAVFQGGCAVGRWSTTTTQSAGMFSLLVAACAFRRVKAARRRR